MATWESLVDRNLDTVGNRESRSLAQVLFPPSHLTRVAPTEIRVVEGQPFSVTCTSDEYYKVSLSIYSPPTTLGHLLPALYLQTRDQELRSPLDVRGEQRDLRRVR